MACNVFKVNKKDLQLLEKTLVRQQSSVSSTFSGRVTKWDSTLHPELEGSQLKSH